jgi:hypothetical protein
VQRSIAQEWQVWQRQNRGNHAVAIRTRLLRLPPACPEIHDGELTAPTGIDATRRIKLPVPMKPQDQQRVMG